MSRPGSGGSTPGPPAPVAAGRVSPLVGVEEAPQHARALLVVHPSDAHEVRHLAEPVGRARLPVSTPSGGSSTPEAGEDLGCGRHPETLLDQGRSLRQWKAKARQRANSRRRSPGGARAPLRRRVHDRPGRPRAATRARRVVQIGVEGHDVGVDPATASTRRRPGSLEVDPAPPCPQLAAAGSSRIRAHRGGSLWSRPARTDAPAP